MSLSGISLNIIDTAGIRSTEDVVEKIGVKKAKTYARDADLIIYVVDSSTGLDENDEEIMEMIRDRKAIVLLNKMDLDCITTEEDIRKHLDKPVIPVSAKEEQGIDRLEQTVKDMFYDGSISFNDEIYITNMRQKAALKEALDSLNAYEELGSITGESVGEDLVNEIFSKFCMGK